MAATQFTCLSRQRMQCSKIPIEICILAIIILHPLKLTSAYEYLELRFQSKAVRLMGSCFGILSSVFYMGVVMFGPSIALEAVTGFPVWSSIVVISCSAVLYTSIGGIKAVIWTDVFQAVVMIGGMLAILVKGTVDVGGPGSVWNVAEQGGRINFFNFDPDPTVRHTFWNLLIGTFFSGFGIVFSQTTVQRISSTPTVRDAQKVVGIAAPGFPVVLLLAAYEGVVAYSYFASIKRCDPLESKELDNQNQIIPFMVLDIFSSAPGMSGFFLAALFSASLSTVSSSLSSLSAIVWKDIVQPLVGKVSETKATLIAKLSVVVSGSLACGIAFLVSQIGGNIAQIAHVRF